MIGIIVENGVEDKALFERVQVIKTWSEGEWTFHRVEAEQRDFPDMARMLADGPWYMHFWDTGTDELIVLFKDRTFRAQLSNPATYEQAVSFGKKIGVPEEQLNFRTD